MEFCPTLGMTGDYLTKALQGCQFFRFRNIIICICEDEIPSYNLSGRSFLEKQKIKIKGEKEESTRR